MKAGLLSGMVLLCTLSAFAEVPVQSNFDIDRFIGKWFGIGLASTSSWFQNMKDKMKMCTNVIKPMADNSLDVTRTFLTSEGCKQKNNIYKLTNEPGRFHSTSTRSGALKVVTMVETNYDDYAIVHTVKNKSTEPSIVVQLLGRTKVQSPEVIEKFISFCQQQGLTPEKIVIMPESEECTVAVV
ncbi:lipocalin-like [Protopterus annectens]|uniref:lipocalin-like n=1 Tax=Protopterus annectens TaxID=7888 RepID=UPI001CFBEB95|nr:lipocalin-like [Protopterus annectens]